MKGFERSFENEQSENKVQLIQYLQDLNKDANQAKYPATEDSIPQASVSADASASAPANAWAQERCSKGPAPKDAATSAHGGHRPTARFFIPNVSEEYSDVERHCQSVCHWKRFRQSAHTYTVGKGNLSPTDNSSSNIHDYV